jgi:phage tail-like protein
VGGVTGISRFGVEIAPAPDGLSFLVDAGRLTLTLTPRADPALHQWFSEVSKGKDIRKSITIVLRADRSAPERRYTFHEAWPCRWKAPELNSNSDTYIVEELEFAVERVERG